MRWLEAVPQERSRQSCRGETQTKTAEPTCTLPSEANPSTELMSSQKPLSRLAPDLQKKARALQQLIEQEAPSAIGALGVAFAQSNFERQGFQGSSLQKWPPRKTTRRGRDLTRYRRGKRAGKLSKFGRSQKGRALLVKSGALRAGFHYKVGPGRVTIYNYQPYALAHNEGTDRLPQRKMLGRSPLLERQIAQWLSARVRQTLSK